MISTADPPSKRQLDDLRALSDVELLHEWGWVGRHLCDRNLDDFHLLFQKLVKAVPVATASERMPNVMNWGKLGWYLLASSDHNREVLAVTIVEVRAQLDIGGLLL